MHVANPHDWVLLKDVQDWEAYQTRVAVLLNVPATMVQWGMPPAQYPCLAATTTREVNDGTVHTHRTRLLTCLLYVGEALELVRAAGHTVLEPPPVFTYAPPRVQPEPAPVESASAETAGWRRQVAEAQRSTSANLLTIAHFLVETGICRRDAYEEQYQRFLREIDQLDAGRREALGSAVQHVTAKRRPGKREEGSV